MEWTFSKHAEERLKKRGLKLDLIKLVLNHPDDVAKPDPCKKVFQKKIFENDSVYLIRVFVNTCREPNLVITAYKTSKIEKYGY